MEDRHGNFVEIIYDDPHDVCSLESFLCMVISFFHRTGGVRLHEPGVGFFRTEGFRCALFFQNEKLSIYPIF